MRPAHRMMAAAGLAVALVAGGTTASYALWTAPAATTATVSAATVGITQTGFSDLAGTTTPTFTAPSQSVTSAVTITNPGTAAVSFSTSVALGAGASSTLPGAVQVVTWPRVGASCATVGSTTTGTWAAPPVITGTLAAGASAVHCIRTTITGSLDGSTVSPTLTVSAGSGGWNASASASTDQTTQDLTAPTAPLALTATGTTETSTTLTWAASSDFVGVTGYQVYRNGVAVGSVVTTPTFTDTGLTPGTTYAYTVTASDAAGNASAPSAALPVTTLSQTPLSPTAWYWVRNEGSGLCLDVEASGGSGSRLIQWGCGSQSNQQWQFATNGRVSPRHASNLSWTVANNNFDGAVVDMRTTLGNRSKWTVVPVPGTSSYQFQSVQYSSRCLAIVGGSTASLATTEVRTCDAASAAQRFTIRTTP